MYIRFVNMTRDKLPDTGAVNGGNLVHFKQSLGGWRRRVVKNHTLAEPEVIQKLICTENRVLEVKVRRLSLSPFSKSFSSITMNTEILRSQNSSVDEENKKVKS